MPLPAPVKDLEPARARELLRKLRDLNLSTRGLVVRGSLAVQLAGCLSLDGPVEQGVRYRLRDPFGERTLGLRWVEGELEVTLDTTSRRLELVLDDQDRLAVPEIRARLADTAGPRQVEHFLRRIVRSAYSA